jgi:membrane-bound lytic murein transglycosylase B
MMDKKFPRRDKHRIPAAAVPGAALLFFLVLFWVFPSACFADWSPLIDRLAADGLDEPALRDLFSRPTLKFEPGPMSCKLDELLKKPSRTPQGLPSTPKYIYKGLLKERVITRARSYLRENTDLLETVSKEYCVPKEIIVSILLVETRLGDFVGGKGAFNSLASMALSSDLEMIRPYLPKRLIHAGNEDRAREICRNKADWAYYELRALILYSQWSGLDPLSLPGSIYGAIGLCQFMPSNVLYYGVDADNDGRVDLFVKSDALHSIANYLRGHGWQCTMDKRSQAKVIYDYNRSSRYVNTVLAVAERLKNKSRSRK